MQRAQIAAFFANIALNPVLVFGIPGIWDGIGFNGIAVSTVLSQTGVMVYVAYRLMQTELMDGVTGSCFRPETGPGHTIHQFRLHQAIGDINHDAGLRQDGGHGDSVETDAVPDPGDAEYENRVQSDIGEKSGDLRSLHRHRIALRLQQACCSLRAIRCRCRERRSPLFSPISL